MQALTQIQAYIVVASIIPRDVLFQQRVDSQGQMMQNWRLGRQAINYYLPITQSPILKSLFPKYPHMPARLFAVRMTHQLGIARHFMLESPHE